MRIPYETNAGSDGDEASPRRRAAERQSAPRIHGLFPATVRGADADGAKFELTTLLENLSASDFSLRLARCVEPGAQLFVVAQIYEATVALRGSISRVEQQPDGACWLTVTITRYRFSSKLRDSSANRA